MFGKMKFEIMSTMQLLHRHGVEVGGPAQQFIDSEVIKHTAKYVPLDQSDLIKSAIKNTKIGSGEVVYATPYARRLYYNPHYNFDGSPTRGAHWFERMKPDHRKQILDGAAKIVKQGGF